MAIARKNRPIGMALCVLLALALVTGCLTACCLLDARIAADRADWWMSTALVQERHGIPRGVLHAAASSEALNAIRWATEAKLRGGYFFISSLFSLLAMAAFAIELRWMSHTKVRHSLPIG